MQEPNTKTTHFKVDFSFGHQSLIYDELTIKHSDMIVIIPHRSSDDGDKYGRRYTCEEENQPGCGLKRMENGFPLWRIWGLR